MTNHKPDCGYWLDQYSWECDCGAIVPRSGLTPLSSIIAEAVEDLERTMAELETMERSIEQDRQWAAVVAAARG